MGEHVRIASDAVSGEELLQRTFGVRGRFNTEVHASDQMLNFVASVLGKDEVAWFYYVRSGAQLMDLVRQLVRWRFGGFEKVVAFLDFASGFGRLTRFLVQELDAERIWVSDIQADAVAFQVEQFGVHGFVSEANPADLRVEEKFDCIFVASLFSHLPEATFVPWLSRLYGMLMPGGMLMFTVHDESLLEEGLTMPASGLHFKEDSEIDELDKREYGVSYVSEEFVRRAIGEASGGPHEYGRVKHVLYYQDLYFVVNEEGVDYEGLKFEYGTGGVVDYCYWSAEDEVCVGGWTVDATEGSEIEEIAVYVGGKLRQRCLPGRSRPDVSAHFRDERYAHSGWECFCYVPGGSDGDLLTVVARTSGGGEYLQYFGSVGALVGPARAGSSGRAGGGDGGVVGQLEARLRKRDAEYVELEGYARRLEEELREARAPRLPWKRGK